MALTFRGPESVPVTLSVNDREVQVLIEPRRTLLSVLREELGLTGAKHGCGRGQCGACTVIVDGLVVDSCLVPVCQVDGSEIRTVEGLSDAETAALNPLQQAFLEFGGAQCGICTPGMLMAAACLDLPTIVISGRIERISAAGTVR